MILKKNQNHCKVCMLITVKIDMYHHSVVIRVKIYKECCKEV